MSGVHPFRDVQGENRRLLVALDGRVKLLLLFAALAVNLVAGGVRTPLLLALTATLLVLAARVRLLVFLQRMVVPGLLAVVAFTTQLFWYAEGAELLTLRFFSGELVVRAGAVARGAELAARILGGTSMLLFFSLTTPLPELMRAARFFRAPPVLVELALIMYRYIFLLLEEAVRIRWAQKARLGFVGLGSALRSSGILGGMLVLRTYDRAERSFAAMRCRGYRGVLTVVPPARLQGHDWGALVAGLALLAGIYALR